MLVILTISEARTYLAVPKLAYEPYYNGLQVLRLRTRRTGFAESIAYIL
jgi:hypothetical protein